MFRVSPLTPIAFVCVQQYLFGSIITYNVSITFTKLSILLQYRRLFVAKPMRRAIYITMIIVAVYGFEACLSGILTCIPVYAFWDVRIQPTAKCLPMFKLVTVQDTS